MIIDKKDNVGVCLEGNATVLAGHKYALRPIAEGEAVVKYGEIIGKATRPIAAGDWVHTHNLRSHLDESVEYAYSFRADVPAPLRFRKTKRRGKFQALQALQAFQKFQKFQKFQAILNGFKRF